jgi:hypothetical protein
MPARAHQQPTSSREGETYRHGICLDPVLNPTMPVDDLAIVLNTGRTATYDAIKRGDLDVPIIKIGRKWRVPTAAVRRLLELDPIAQAEQAPEEPPKTARRLTRTTSGRK